MKTLLILLVFLVSAGSAQTTQMKKVSPIYNVEVRPGECDLDDRCGPLTIVLSRKSSRSAFQTLTAGRIPKTDIIDCVQFVDLDFDGIRDLAVFDGFEGPGGYATLAQRIYLYSKRTKRFEFNSGLSELSHNENLGSFEVDWKQRFVFTYARLGSGVFQRRGYRLVKGEPVLMYETVDDAQFANGTLTKLTTRKLINGRWRTWVKTYKGQLNE